MASIFLKMVPLLLKPQIERVNRIIFNFWVLHFSLTLGIVEPNKCLFYKYVTIFSYKLFKNRWLSQTSELCGTLKSSKIGLAFFTPISLMGFKISPFLSIRSSKYPIYFEYEPAYVKQFHFSVSENLMIKLDLNYYLHNWYNSTRILCHISWIIT